jgi:hypothetical protein
MTNLEQFNRRKLQFAVEVLEGVTGGPVANVPHLIPRILELTIERFQEIGIGGGHA